MCIYHMKHYAPIWKQAIGLILEWGSDGNLQHTLDSIIHTAKK